MRTLALLAALLLLAFQAWAQNLQEAADQVPAQDQPGTKDQDQLGAKDQDQLGVEDLNLLADEIQDLLEAEDMVDSVTGEERLTREAPGRLIETLCKCQHAHCDLIQSVLRALGLQSKICGP